jgi:hypothetical protein
MYYIDEQKYFVHKLKNSCKIPWFDIVWKVWKMCDKL